MPSTFTQVNVCDDSIEWLFHKYSILYFCCNAFCSKCIVYVCFLVCGVVSLPALVWWRVVEQLFFFYFFLFFLLFNYYKLQNTYIHNIIYQKNSRAIAVF